MNPGRCSCSPIPLPATCFACFMSAQVSRWNFKCTSSMSPFRRASKIDGTQNITLASLEPKNQCLMSYAGYVHGQSSSNISPRKLDQRGKRGALEGEDPTVVRFEKPSPKRFICLVVGFNPSEISDGKSKQLNSKEFWSQSPRDHWESKQKTHRHLWSKQMAGGFPCSSAFEGKKTMISVDNLRNKFLLAGSPGSCKPESSEGVHFHKPKKRNTTPLKQTWWRNVWHIGSSQLVFVGASVLGVLLNTHLS